MISLFLTFFDITLINDYGNMSLENVQKHKRWNLTPFLFNLTRVYIHVGLNFNSLNNLKILVQDKIIKLIYASTIVIIYLIVGGSTSIVSTLLFISEKIRF